MTERKEILAGKSNRSYDDMRGVIAELLAHLITRSCLCHYVFNSLSLAFPMVNGDRPLCFKGFLLLSCYELLPFRIYGAAYKHSENVWSHVN